MLTEDIITQIINQTIDDPEKAATILTKLVGANPKNIQNFLIIHGSRLKGGARLLGPFGAALGVHDDIDNYDKTIGEAIVHNVTGVAAGSVGVVGYALIFGTTPVGWAAAGTMVVGLGVYTAFEYAYDHNYLKIQDGLDYVGGFVQGTIDVLGGWFEVIGESIQYNLDNHQFYNWYN